MARAHCLHPGADCGLNHRPAQARSSGPQRGCAAVQAGLNLNRVDAWCSLGQDLIHRKKLRIISILRTAGGKQKRQEKGQAADHGASIAGRGLRAIVFGVLFLRAGLG